MKNIRSLLSNVLTNLAVSGGDQVDIKVVVNDILRFAYMYLEFEGESKLSRQSKVKLLNICGDVFAVIPH